MTRGTKTLDELRAYWAAAAAVDRDASGLRPTARDPYLQEVVETEMARWIRRGDRMLDVGCGDGLSTLRFARESGSALGVDFIPEYVEKATRNAAETGAEDVRFEVGNVLDLEPVRGGHGAFDVVTTIRCLINLTSWENQARGLKELAGCVRPGGLFMTSEGWLDGMEGLNLRRIRAGLTPIQVVDYNRMIDRAQFELEAAKYFEVIGYRSTGLYLYLSRVVQPCLTSPEPPRHDHPLNRVASTLQVSADHQTDFADCDYAGVYVMRRKA